VLRFLLGEFALSMTTVRGTIEKLLTRVSKEIAVDPEDEIPDVDRDFEESDEDETSGKNPSTFSRPTGVTDGDWRVYEVFDEALRELEQKFRAMWA